MSDREFLKNQTKKIMFIQVECWNVKCDGCGLEFDGGEFSGWNDKSYSYDVAQNEDWEEIDGSHYCPECWQWNEDETEVIPKIKSVS